MTDTRVTSLRGEVLYETDHTADVFVSSFRTEVAYVSDQVSSTQVTSASMEVLYKWSYTTPAPALSVVGTLVTQQFAEVLASSQAEGFVGTPDYLEINFKGLSPGVSVTQKKIAYEKKKNSIHRTRTNKKEDI